MQPTLTLTIVTTRRCFQSILWTVSDLFFSWIDFIIFSMLVRLTCALLSLFLSFFLSEITPTSIIPRFQERFVTTACCDALVLGCDSKTLHFVSRRKDSLSYSFVKWAYRGGLTGEELFNVEQQLELIISSFPLKSFAPPRCSVNTVSLVFIVLFGSLFIGIWVVCACYSYCQEDEKRYR